MGVGPFELSIGLLVYSAGVRCSARQPFPLSADRGGHWWRGSGGVPSGRGETIRAEISPPPVIRTVFVSKYEDSAPETWFVQTKQHF